MHKKKKSRRVPPLSQKKSMKHTNQEFCRQKGPPRESPLQWKRHGTFSTSERDDRDWFCRTSGAVNARRSWWETLSSVNDTLPDGSKRRDHGEMMNPRAAGSAVFARRKKKKICRLTYNCFVSFLDVTLFAQTHIQYQYTSLFTYGAS